MVNDIQSTVVLHWIPSHIELATVTGMRRITGNTEADTLANNAAKSNDIPLDYRVVYSKTQSKLQYAAAKFVYGIDKLLQKKWESLNSQNASPSQDDIRPSDAQQFPNGNL